MPDVIIDERVAYNFAYSELGYLYDENEVLDTCIYIDPCGRNHIVFKSPYYNEDQLDELFGHFYLSGSAKINRERFLKGKLNYPWKIDVDGEIGSFSFITIASILQKVNIVLHNMRLISMTLGWLYSLTDNGKYNILDLEHIAKAEKQIITATEAYLIMSGKLGFNIHLDDQINPDIYLDEEEEPHLIFRSQYSNKKQLQLIGKNFFLAGEIFLKRRIFYWRKYEARWIVQIKGYELHIDPYTIASIYQKEVYAPSDMALMSLVLSWIYNQSDSDIL